MARVGTRRTGGPSRVALVALGIGAAAVLATPVAALAVTARIARMVVTPPRRHDYDVAVLGRDRKRSTITLSHTPDTSVPGRYGLFFDGDRGYLRVGEVVRSGQAGVTRRLERVDFGELRDAVYARWSGAWYLEPEELGLPVRSVAVPGQLGDAPAWLFPAAEADDDGRWVIVVHGRGARREEGLRAVPVFHEHGHTVLLISYRNDGDAPASPDRRYGLGGTEWHDVDAAIEYALRNGARSIVLMGWSMGGAIVLQTATRSRHRHAVVGLVLDSPVIDWVDTLRFQARLLRVPSFLATAAMRMLGARWGNPLTGQSQAIDLPGLDFVARAPELRLPTLILHSDDDGYVPSTGSRELAAARGDIVTLVSFERAKHTRLWNYDPERWTTAIGDWLAAHTR